MWFILATCISLSISAIGSILLIVFRQGRLRATLGEGLLHLLIVFLEFSNVRMSRFALFGLGREVDQLRVHTSGLRCSSNLFCCCNTIC